MTGVHRYDYNRGRNLNLIQNQLGATLWDLEWTNGTSFYFDREANTCRQIAFPVGILAPDWLKGADYLGQDNVSSHLCNVWLKGPRKFITYWADVETGEPVRWIFGWDGAVFDIMTWDTDVLEEERWQAPQSCFEQAQQPLRLVTAFEAERSSMSRLLALQHVADQ